MTALPAPRTPAPAPAPAALPHQAWAGRMAGMAWALAAGLALAWAAPSLAQAAVRALPAPASSPIDRASLNAASPHAPGPDNPAREKMVQTLRAVAQSDRASPRKHRPPAPRAPGDVSPPDAAWLLGLLALHGLAMPADPPQAQQWFERAQMLGHPLAPAGLAWCQISGCVTSPNPAAAMHWIALLRRTDPGLAKILEWHAAKALAPLADPDPDPGPTPRAPQHRLLAEAARAGNAQARNELGLEHLAAGELEQALAQFHAAAARSQAAAANARLLAGRIQGSPGTQTRPARYSASDWYQEARRYHRGDGVPANYTEAVRLYQIAASSGDAQARKMLELIFSRPTQGGSIDIAWMQQLAALEISPSGQPQNATAPVATYGWQRDPSPLYELVPPEWRTPGPAPRR